MIPPTPKDKQEEGSINFESFPFGLNTAVPASMIAPVELSNCVDWKYNSRGQLETRGAIVKYSTTATTKSISTIGSATIAGVERVLACDADYEVYYLNGTVWTSIGTAIGVANFLSYNNVAMVLDGSYVKYLDGVTSIKMAYDTGETIYDKYNGDDDGTTALSAAGVGCVFTTPAWDAGFTMPPVTVTAKVVSASSGSIEASFYDVTGTTEVAAKTYTGEIPTVLNYVDITFAATDITTELAPSTQYYCLLKGANTDLSHSTVASGGTLITAGSTPDTAKDPVMRINPGLPPKASYGAISDKRPFLWGDTAKPGEIPYGKLSHLEYGYLTTVDESRISFPVGGLEDLYGDLWVYGKEDHPYIAKLTGDTESDWSVNLTYQRAWTLPKTLVNVGNDLFSTSSDGVDSLQGVQEYGDIRAFSESDSIFDKFSNWSSTTFAAYYPKEGQYWLYMPGYSKVLVCHINRPYNSGNKVGYPWTEYTLPIVPTTFKQAGSNFLIGSSDGHVYTFDTTEYKDLTTTQIDPVFKTAYIEFPFSTVNLEMLQFVASSQLGANFTLNIYKNGGISDYAVSYPISLSIFDDVTVAEMLMTVGDATMIISGTSQNPSRKPLNINCWSCQLEVKDVKVFGKPMFLNGMFLRYIKTDMIWHS